MAPPVEFLILFRWIWNVYQPFKRSYIIQHRLTATKIEFIVNLNKKTLSLRREKHSLCLKFLLQNLIRCQETMGYHDCVLLLLSNHNCSTLKLKVRENIWGPFGIRRHKKYKATTSNDFWQLIAFSNSYLFAVWPKGKINITWQCFEIGTWPWPIFSQSRHIISTKFFHILL